MATVEINTSELTEAQLLQYNLLTQLCEKRNSIQEKLHKIELAHQQFAQGNIDVYAFQARISMMERIQKQFMGIQQQIYDNPFVFEEDEEEFEVMFMSMFKKLEAEAKVLMKPSETVTSENHPKLKLPEISLPKFDENNFSDFRESFEILIHRTGLSKLEKFIYLTGACSGTKAEDLLSGYQLIEANYEVAWEDLVAHFGSLRKLTDKHVSEILKVKPLNKECGQDLRKLLTTFSVHLKQLKQTVPKPEDLFDLFIVHIASWKLDEETRRAWESEVQREEIHTWEKLEAFLDHQCQVLEQMERSARKSSTIKSTRTETIGPKKSCQGIPNTTSLITCTQSKISCHVCNAKHLTFKCRRLIELKNVKDRVNKVRERNLCMNCLGPNHIAKSCQSNKVCKVCNLKHHTLLHCQ